MQLKYTLSVKIQLKFQKVDMKIIERYNFYSSTTVYFSVF